MNLPTPAAAAGGAGTPVAASDRLDAWRRARRVLLLRVDNLGDVLMTTPAIMAVGADPARRLTLVASRAGAALAPYLLRVDDVLVHDAAWVKGPAASPTDDRRFVARLARRRFDAAIVFTVCTQSALPAATLLRLAGIPLRLAYSRENPYDLLTDRLPELDAVGPGMRHEVRRQLDLVAAVGFGTPVGSVPPLVFATRAADRRAVQERLAAAGIGPAQPYLVVHPGSTAASRRYPPERFGAAAARIAAKTGAAIVFAGGPDDLAACTTAAAVAGGGARLDGRLGLGELGALIEGARLCVCNNSGPAHLAAAVRTPVVVAYALTNPQHTPWAVPARVLSHPVPCRDCLKSVCPMVHHRCLLGIEVDEVVDAALSLWDETAPQRAGPRPTAVAVPDA